MNEEPKSAAELKEIRINRKLAQEADGAKAMAEIAAADIAIRKRTAKLRAIRLAKEAAERDKPEARPGAISSNTTTVTSGTALSQSDRNGVSSSVLSAYGPLPVARRQHSPMMSRRVPPRVAHPSTACIARWVRTPTRLSAAS